MGAVVPPGRDAPVLMHRCECACISSDAYHRRSWGCHAGGSCSACGICSVTPGGDRAIRMQGRKCAAGRVKGYHWRRWTCDRSRRVGATGGCLTPSSNRAIWIGEAERESLSVCGCDHVGCASAQQGLRTLVERCKGTTIRYNGGHRRRGRCDS